MGHWLFVGLTDLFTVSKEVFVFGFTCILRRLFNAVVSAHRCNGNKVCCRCNGAQKRLQISLWKQLQLYTARYHIASYMITRRIKNNRTIMTRCEYEYSTCAQKLAVSDLVLGISENKPIKLEHVVTCTFNLAQCPTAGCCHLVNVSK